MNRRHLFLTAAATGLAVVLPAAAAPVELRVVERYSYVTDSWARVRMWELRKGDVFRLDEVGTFRAYADPAKNADGTWGIKADTEIDPATNEWVDCAVRN